MAGALARGVQRREVAVRAALHEGAAGRLREAGEVGEPAQGLVLGLHGAGRLDPRAAVERVHADQQVGERGRRRRRVGDEGHVARVVDRGAGRQQRVAQERHHALAAEALARDRPARQLARLARQAERGRVGGQSRSRAASKTAAASSRVGVVQAHTPARVALVDPALLAGAARERQLGRLAVLEQRLQVGAVLAQDRGRPRAVDRRAVAGHDVVGLLDQRLEPRQRGQVRGHGALGVQHRDLDRRQVVAAHEHARPRDPDRHAVLGVPVGGLQLELAIADLDLARHRQPLGARQRERPRALDVVLLVELAQGALGGAGLVDQPPGGRVRSSRAAPRGTRSGRAGGPSRRAWRAGRRR